jgi:hypothetical protein
MYLGSDVIRGSLVDRRTASFGTTLSSESRGAKVGNPPNQVIRPTTGARIDPEADFG